MPRSAESRRAWIAWGAVCVIWGTTYLAIKYALTTIPPFLIGGLRYTVAGLLLGGVLWSRGDLVPPRRTWAGFLLLGVLMFGVGNGGVVWAEVWVPSGLAAVVIATSPFWMVGVEACLPDGERLTWRHVLGLAVGFGGILLLVGPTLLLGGGNAARTLAGVVALQLACAGWAVGSAYGRRHAARVSPGMSAAAQMLCGGAVMLAAGTVLGEWGALRFSGASVASLIYLTLAGSIAGFGAYVYALSHLPVSVVSLYAYINPIIAVALGTLVLGERFDTRMLIAIGIILVGLAVVSRARQAPTSSMDHVRRTPADETRAPAARSSR